MDVLVYAVFKLGVHMIYALNGHYYLHVRNRTIDLLTGKPYSKTLCIDGKLQEWLNYNKKRTKSMPSDPDNELPPGMQSLLEQISKRHDLLTDMRTDLIKQERRAQLLRVLLTTVEKYPDVVKAFNDYHNASFDHVQPGDKDTVGPLSH